MSIDNVGGELLAGLVRHVGLWGQVACIGMASSPDLATSVFPLILRGVSLLGVSSGNCPMPLRHEVWTRLGADLKPPQLDAIASREVPLDAVIETASLLMERRALGRVLVRLLSPGAERRDAIGAAAHGASTAQTGSWSLASVSSSAAPAAPGPGRAQAAGEDVVEVEGAGGVLHRLGRPGEARARQLARAGPAVEVAGHDHRPGPALRHPRAPTRAWSRRTPPQAPAGLSKWIP